MRPVIAIAGAVLLLTGCTDGYDDSDWSVLAPACCGGRGEPGHCAAVIGAPGGRRLHGVIASGEPLPGS